MAPRSRRKQNIAATAALPPELDAPDPSRARSAAAATGMGALLVYVATLHPSIPGGDSAEFIGVAVQGGVPHPSGYPLFVLLSKIYLLLPFGSLAWRVNLLSACCGAGAAAALALAVIRYSRSIAAGVLAGGLFAFCPLIWTYAVAAEVFSLNNLLVALLLYFSVRYAETFEWGMARAAALVVGLALSDHLISVFVSLPLVIWAISANHFRIATPRLLGRLACWTFLGLTPYLYLPWASAHVPAISWGDETTLNGFLDHVFRRDYGSFSLAGNPQSVGPSLTTQLGYYGIDTLWQTLVVGWVLAIPGMVIAIRRDRTRSLGIAVAGCYFFYVLVFHAMANLPVDQSLFRGVQARFWQQADLLLFFWIGVGFAHYRARLGGLGRRVVVGLVCVQLLVHFRSMDQHSNYAVRDYGLAMLRPLPPHALVLCQGDLISNPLIYLTRCEGIRSDVQVLDESLLTYRWSRRLVAARYPDVILPGLRYFPGEKDAYDIRQFLGANFPRQPVFVYGGFRAGDSSANGHYDLWPLGIGDRVVRSGDRLDFASWLKESAAALPLYDLPDSSRYGTDSWEHVVLSDYWIARHRRAFRMLTEAIAHPDLSLLEATRQALEEIARSFPDAPSYVYKNLGLVYGRLIGHRADASARMIQEWRHYLSMDPQNDPDIPAIQQAVK